jgi:hypothetical protein
MKWDFVSEDGLCLYRIIYPALSWPNRDGQHFVDVLMYEPPEVLATKSWSYSIEEREALLVHIGLFGDMPKEVKSYIDDLLKLKAFW